MTIKVRKILWAVDCEPLGYKGLEVVFWLNPPVVADEEAPEPTKDEGKEKPKRAPWDNEYYRHLALIVEEVRVPAEHTDSGKAEVLAVDGPEAAYKLEQGEGSDPQILQWTVRQYSGQRQERLKAELKN